jgi:hypothetical protein
LTLKNEKSALFYLTMDPQTTDLSTEEVVPSSANTNQRMLKFFTKLEAKN